MGCCLEAYLHIPKENQIQTNDSRECISDEPKKSLLLRPFKELNDYSSSLSESHEEVQFHHERCPLTINQQLTEAYRNVGKGISKSFEKECLVLRKEFLMHSLHTQASVDPEVLSSFHNTLAIKDEDIRSAVRRRMTISPRYSVLIPMIHGVRVCRSFNEYHAHRDNLVEPYEVILQRHDPKWKDHAKRIIEMLQGMKCHLQWSRLEHIGSTAIEGLVAKPIVDLMIVLWEDEDLKKCFDQILQEQEDLEDLPIKIAFTSKAPGSDDDWGFFQVPRNAAEGSNMCEVNIHVYLDGTESVRDKLVFRDFLKAEEGKTSRTEYGRVKLELMERLENNELSVSQYSRSKDEIVSKILVEAKRWRNGDLVSDSSSSIFVLSRAKTKCEVSESYSEAGSSTKPKEFFPSANVNDFPEENL